MTSPDTSPIWELQIIDHGVVSRRSVGFCPEDNKEASLKYFLELEDFDNRIRIIYPTKDKCDAATQILLQTSEMESGIFVTPPEVGNTLEQVEYGKKFIVRRIQ
jgi:hypothetical protein